MRRSGVQLRGDARAFAGQIDLLQRHRVGQQVAAGAVPTAVAVVTRLGRALVEERAVPAPREVEIPGAELLHPRPRRMRSGLGDARHRPEDVEEIAGVSRVALRSVGGDAHA